MRKNLLIGAIVLIGIVLLGYFLFQGSDSDGGEVLDDSFLIYEEPEIPISLNNIYGDWKGVSEEFIGGKNENLEDHSISFNEDKSYSAVEYGVIDEGVYKLENNRILFTESLEDFELEGVFLEAFVDVKGNELILTYPQFRKTVVFVRE